MLEMETGELSMVGLDSSEQNLLFYSPEQPFHLQYKQQLVGGGNEGLQAKQLCTQSFRLTRDLLSEEGLGAIATKGMERIPSRDQKEKPVCTAVPQSYKTQHMMTNVGMPSQQLCATQSIPFRFSCDVLDDVEKSSSREQQDKSTTSAAASPADYQEDAIHELQRNEAGRSDESNDLSKNHFTQDQDIISVIASSLSQFNLMQQQTMNSRNPESGSGLKPLMDGVTQKRSISRQVPEETYLRSNIPHNVPLYPTWDASFQQQWNQQQRYVNQLLLSRTGQLLPSSNSDLASVAAAAISKFQLQSARPVHQMVTTPKSASDLWLAEELVNGCNALNLQQTQQSSRFDAQNFPAMNPDFLDILQPSEHLKKDGGLLNSLSMDQIVPNVISPMHPSGIQLGLHIDHYSRKVFVGGLPPDIAEEEIVQSFRKFGPLVVDWPHKAESKSYFPPKGYCFLLFQDEMSVQTLISSCVKDDGKLYWSVSSPTIKDKPVQIRPWNLADSDFVMDGSQPLDPRKTIFVGGVPRPLRAVELAVVMNRLYGGVCYAGIDTDPELKYPKGAGRVAFSNQQSYIAAISARFVQLQHADIDKRVEVKPYVLDDQLCDECQGTRCGGKFAPYFCANVACLQYYCEHCWNQIHARPGREFHKPLVKEGADRPRTLPFRWC